MNDVRNREIVSIKRKKLRDIIRQDDEKDFVLIEDKIISSDPEDGGADHEVIIQRRFDDKFFGFSYSDWDLGDNFLRDFPNKVVEMFPKNVMITIYE